VTQEHLEFLDDLRESGDTNMYGAGPYLDAEFPDLNDGRPSHHSSDMARKILVYWMESFGKADR
jgi:hypothetical protein